MSELIARGTLMLKAQGADLKRVAAAILDDQPVEVLERPMVAPKIPMTDGLVRALGVLPAVFGKVQPETVRPLAPEEIALLAEERAAIDEILKVLTARKKAIRTTVYHAMDIRARCADKVTAETERDVDGHLILGRKGDPERMEIPDSIKEWSRERKAPEVEFDEKELERLAAEGEIDRETYLSFTRSVRVFDENKAFNAIAGNPGLLEVLKKITKRGRPSTSLFVRNKKK